MQLSHPLSAVTKAHWPTPVSDCIGYAAIAHLGFAGGDFAALTRELVKQVQGPVIDAGALLDLSTVLQMQGGEMLIEGLLLQVRAVSLQQTYRIIHGDGSGPVILAFVTPGNFMANVPIDFLLRNTNAILLLHFVDARTADLNDLPQHDVAFMAIAESADNAQTLLVMAQLLAGWRGPILNNAASLIACLTRERVSQLLGNEPTLYMPPTYRMDRATLIRLAMGEAQGDLHFPLVIRPIGSHAGAGLEKIANPAGLAHWLRYSELTEAYVAPFVDIRDTAGFYKKQRVVLIKGKPFASHQAASTNWIVHYSSADMAGNPILRAQEADWMRTFDSDFAQHHAKAFAALYRLLGLDYFGFDCAELPDGRLLIFEIDVAMIVHDLDSAEIFPYKKPVMQKLFDGFVAAAEQTAFFDAKAVRH